ncbi:AraC family transcriptional regulator [Mucilaginibacter conchicola]|uniref:AraC family transcriptional regulator n=1 Tax=Mucilaginibacter conchicola TaxID=2303333 RepID=A0A372NX13_9SPHI|nr:AraC family transcriptional regulator [Mucilaginibacter conchicola]RFZ94650.1 AraC family transcriptional regulator [Mucilaginibacter conchicola]
MDFNAAQRKGVKEGFIGQKMIVLPPNIKKRLLGNALTSGFYLTAIGFYPKAENHDIYRKTGSGQYILLYCIEGEGHIEINNAAHHLKPNTYFVVPKNITHRYYSDPQNPWTIYWAHFTGPVADNLYQRYLDEQPAQVRDIPLNQNAIEVFEQLYNILENSFNDESLEIVNMNFQYFINSLIYYPYVKKMIYDKDSVSKAISYMKQNINRHFSLEQLANLQGLSISQFSRHFKQKTGSTPIQYFNFLKIQHSCQYLYFTEKSVKEICVELGFDDQFYFTRLFTGLMGVSPTQYRKTHKK